MTVSHLVVLLFYPSRPTRESLESCLCIARPHDLYSRVNKARQSVKCDRISLPHKSSNSIIDEAILMPKLF
jgi:hypothetical protein